MRRVCVGWCTSWCVSAAVDKWTVYECPCVHMTLWFLPPYVIVCVCMRVWACLCSCNRLHHNASVVIREQSEPNKLQIADINTFPFPGEHTVILPHRDETTCMHAHSAFSFRIFKNAAYSLTRGQIKTVAYSILISAAVSCQWMSTLWQKVAAKHYKIFSRSNLSTEFLGEITWDKQRSIFLFSFEIGQQQHFEGVW